MAPELRLPFVNPEQAVAHRSAEIGRPQVGPATELAVPAVDKFVRQEIMVEPRGLPVEEIAGLVLVLARAVMFEADAAHPVSDSVEKFVAVIMLCTEQLQRLVNKVAVQLDGLGFGGQFLLAVCHRVERNALAEIVLAEIFAGKDRAVDQDFVIGGFISDGVTRRGRGAQRGRGLPALGISD